MWQLFPLNFGALMASHIKSWSGFWLASNQGAQKGNDILETWKGHTELKAACLNFICWGGNPLCMYLCICDASPYDWLYFNDLKVPVPQRAPGILTGSATHSSASDITARVGQLYVLTQIILIITGWGAPVNELRLRFGEEGGKAEREGNSPLTSQASRCRDRSKREEKMQTTDTHTYWGEKFTAL